MSIAPVTCSVEVKAPVARAFDLFVQNMSAWWPRGRTPGAQPHAELVIEPRPQGRWYERNAEGHETQWGTVLDWDPPRRMLLGWQLNHQFHYDPQILTEVEIRFDPLAEGGTRVSLEHRNLERFGANAETLAGKIRSGWPERMGNFAQYAATHN